MAPTPAPRRDVEQHGDLDAPPLDEGDRLHHVAPGGELARQRLVQGGQRRGVQRQQRAGDQLGRAAAAAAMARPLVERLHQRHVVVLDERRDQPRHPGRHGSS